VTTEVDHIVLWVKDRARALDFYERVVGFPCCNDWREERGLFPSVRVNERMMLDLFPRAGSVLARLVARERKLSGAGKPINHVCFSMPRTDYEALRARLIEAGVSVTSEAHTQVGARGVAAGSFYFQDPDANVLQIMHYEPATP
jgi:catechol 2,3-dioxygenase-like lactoylglutathione lyase family enzyme